MVDPRGTGGGLVPLGQLEKFKPGERPTGGRRWREEAPEPDRASTAARS